MVFVGRMLAGVIIVMGFTYSFRIADDVSDSFTAFLNYFATPLALAFVIIMATEILKELRELRG